MFNIDYIKVFQGTHQRIRKNLKVGHEYRFEEKLEPDFFAHHINVHAIVGKNGSGKSTLLEIMFRLANNLSFVLMKDIPRDAADNLCYVFGLYAEMGWHEGDKYGVLKCEDRNVIFSCGDAVSNFEVMEQAGVRFFMSGHDIAVEYEKVRNVANNFFYTLVMNYSMQSYVAQDYIGEECKSRTSNRHQSWNVKDVWINALFHKNDGYMCPININPYRHEGTIDMNKEMRLTRNRVTALLQYFKYRGQHLIDGYQLHEMIYTYNPFILKGYFNSDKILEMYNTLMPVKDEEEKEHREKYKDENGKKLEWILALFQETLKSEEDNVAKVILREFDINPEAYNDESYRVGMLYLICKVLNIGNTYPKYLLQTLQTKINTKYEIINALDVKSTPEVMNTVAELALMVKDEESHVTLKVRRVLLYLLHYAEIRRNTEYGLEMYEEDFGLTGHDYLNAFDDRHDIEKEQQDITLLYSLKELELLTPPSIYEQHVYLKKENKQGQVYGDPIELSLMSSGERQFVFSVSSIIYHLTNLLSVEDTLPKYHCFNLVIDEVEICFHPEYQRTFLKNLLRLLDRLEFNSGERYINILLTTHSPFLLSDIPESHILYMTQDEELPTGKTFGANIYDLLNQQFFMSNTIGEFVAQKINEVVRVYRLVNNPEIREQLFREGYERMVSLYALIGDEYLRKVVLQMVTEMAQQYNMRTPLAKEDIDRQIQEHEDAIHELKRLRRHRHD
jgi:energy-coupling factor transporter ATP-binding protein EcfA2